MSRAAAAPASASAFAEAAGFRCSRSVERARARVASTTRSRSIEVGCVVLGECLALLYSAFVGGVFSDLLEICDHMPA
uniref:Uncharacterized protein n=1 Tax=Oryza sativa subsp. japonica TaxID=39947 RepID=Q6K6L3_ORYSJ|nr:hypothetical protein [Oryza sativa Japonica Group]